MALQGKGEEDRRSKDIAAARLREMMTQLRPKGEYTKNKTNKEVGRKECRVCSFKRGASEYVVWSCVRGKLKGFAMRREALMAEYRKELAVIEQSKKGLPVRERRLGESWMSDSKSRKLKRGRD